MANSIFNHPAFNIIGRPTMDDFLKRCSDRLGQFGLSQADINDAIKQACDFFNIPMPWVNSRSHKCTKWSNHVCQLDRNSYNDDVLCFNMQQLIDMKVDSKSAFSLVMPHECAHRFLQATRFPGVNNGIWENELAADF